MPSKPKSPPKTKSPKLEILNRRTILEKQENSARMSFLQDHFKEYFKNLKQLQDECNKLGHEWTRLITLNNDGYVCTNCKFVQEPTEE